MAVGGRFVLLDEAAYGFDVGPYQPQYALILDPTVEYSTYLGGGGDDLGVGIVVDSTGHAYVTGYTFSTDFPTQNPLQGDQIALDAFVIKLDPTGSVLLYATYLSGNAVETGLSIAVDDSGHAYVTGRTSSTNFPTTPGAFQPAHQGGWDAFITKLSPTGSALLYATYLGGSGNDEGRGIAIDATGPAYISGVTGSTNFPTFNPFQPTLNPPQPMLAANLDGFITKIDEAGSLLVYSSYLGGSGHEEVRGIAIDAAGAAYVMGLTNSLNFPTVNAFQAMNRGGYDAFVAKVDAAGSAFTYATYLGGRGDEIPFSGRGDLVLGGIAVDASGSAYVMGATLSTDFPTTPGAFQPTFSGGHGSDVFVTKLTGDGSMLAYSTYLGGAGSDIAYGLTVDGAGHALVTGMTFSGDFPVGAGAFQPTPPGLADGFVSMVSTDGSALLYSSFLGGTNRATFADLGVGIAVDDAGGVFVTGGTQSTDFPTIPGVFQSDYAGNGDAFVAKFDLGDIISAVSEILPNRGGDTGTVSVVIRGAGFGEGPIATLVRDGQSDIIGDPTRVRDDGRTVLTTFDLTGKARGAWDVVITNPDNTSAVFPDGFTIEEGRSPQIWVDIIGRSVIRVGRQQVFTILYGNRGNVDAAGVPLWIAGIPKNATWTLGVEITPPPLLDGQETFDWSQVPIHIERDEDILLPLFVSLIPPGIPGILKMTLTVPATQTFQLQAWVNPPIFQSPEQTPAWANCLKGLGGAMLETVGLPDASNCSDAFLKFWVSKGKDIFDAVSDAVKHPVSSMVQIIFDLFTNTSEHVIEVAKECSPDEKQLFRSATATILKTLNIVSGVLLFGADLAEAVVDCQRAFILEGIRGIDVQPVASLDPNEKVGSRGVGQPRYLAGEEPLRYVVFFENLETATAPAQEVVITDQLDIAKMELSTLSLGPITFGDKQVVPSPGLRSITTDIDLRPKENLIVRIAAQLNAAGLLTWRFTSLDPDTGDLPEDPLVGFLPPNKTPPEGEGSVLFTVMPKPGLTTGTEIRNRATIVFDVNPPVDADLAIACHRSECLFDPISPTRRRGTPQQTGES